MATYDRRGREATKPTRLRRGWKDVAWRAKDEMKKDHVTLVAAGVAFYAFFALFPTLFAVIAIYGLVADPAQVTQQTGALRGAVPGGALEIIETQLSRVAGSPQTALGWGLVVSLVIAFWSASKGVRGLIDALNIAYDEKEDRGFFKRTGLTLLLTVGGVVGALLAIGALVIVPAVIEAMDIGTAGAVLAQVARWAVLLGVIFVSLTVLYRYGPARKPAKWRWLAPGNVTAALIIVLASVGFGLYVQWFGNYQKTFGSLAAVAILLMWFYLGALAIVVGAEVNAEAERQTRRDTTAGPEEPVGRRGAHAADTLGSSRGEPQPAS